MTGDSETISGGVLVDPERLHPFNGYEQTEPGLPRGVFCRKCGNTEGNPYHQPRTSALEQAWEVARDFNRSLPVIAAEVVRLRASLTAATEAAASAEPLAEVRELWQRASEREGNLASAVADVVWKATPYGTTENDDVYAYLVPKGAMHRLVGVAQSNGAHVPVAFRALGAAGGSGVTP